jgi:hypothetical protein
MLTHPDLRLLIVAKRRIEEERERESENDREREKRDREWAPTS